MFGFYVARKLYEHSLVLSMTKYKYDALPDDKKSIAKSSDDQIANIKNANQRFRMIFQNSPGKI